MVFNGWCKLLPTYVTGDVAQVFFSGSVLKNKEMWLFSVLLWFYLELENNTSDAVVNQHFQLRRRQRSGKRGGSQGGRKKERRLSLPSRTTPALLWHLTCRNHFLQSASQAPSRQPAPMFRRCGQVWLGFTPFPFPRVCANASRQSVSYKT